MIHSLWKGADESQHTRIESTRVRLPHDDTLKDQNAPRTHPMTGAIPRGIYVISVQSNYPRVLGGGKPKGRLSSHHTDANLFAIRRLILPFSPILSPFSLISLIFESFIFFDSIGFLFRLDLHSIVRRFYLQIPAYPPPDRPQFSSESTSIGIYSVVEVLIVGLLSSVLDF